VATARTVCNLALRKLGVLGSGRDARPADMTDTLDALRGMYTAWVSSGAFGRLRDVVPTGFNYTATGGESIFRQSPSTLTVTLPELVSECQRGDYGREPVRYYGTNITVSTVGDVTTVLVEASQPIGYALPPRDASCVVISDQVGGQTLTSLYDGHIKRWQTVEGLGLDDEAPRSDADLQGLASCLAIEISDQFGSDIAEQTIVAAGRYKTALAARFGMRREPSVGIYM
jgi:hypothetical protein